MIRPPPISTLFPFTSLFRFHSKKKYFSLTLSIVSTFLVHQFPSPFTVISLFSNTFSCPPHFQLSPLFLTLLLPSFFNTLPQHSLFFFKFACCLHHVKKKMTHFLLHPLII